MHNTPGHEKYLNDPALFKSLLAHEVNNSRRYGDSLTLINLFVEADPTHPETQSDVELFMLNQLLLDLRDTDVVCKQEHEFLILMPSTGTPGARTACERIRKKIAADAVGATLNLSFYVGLDSMPVPHPITSAEFTQNAAHALQHARANRLTTGAVAFSDVPKA
jgi:hypothetical protein